MYVRLSAGLNLAFLTPAVYGLTLKVKSISSGKTGFFREIRINHIFCLLLS